MLQTKTILKALPHCLKTINLPKRGEKLQGKVRDFYVLPDKRIIVTTDRQSAFDFVLGTIPYKGAVLNQLAAFWFQKTKHIIPNHLISLPDPNVTIAKNLTPIPVEMIVRGYMSGVTKTSIWYSYQQGERTIYGISFPDELQKNDKLPTPVITPTTHRSPSTNSGSSSGHDERLTKKEILEKKIVSKKIYEQMEKAALKLFSFGSTLAEKKGLILVDTKYEFGLDENGTVTLMDEIHTPDSSRFWIKKTYKQRIEKGLEPENFDKEFLRLWYFEKGYRGDGKPPKMTNDIIVALSKRYISVYEKLTGKRFNPFPYPIEKRIIKNIQNALFKTKKIAVFISNKGTGTNLKALIVAKKRKKLHGDIALVISDKPDALGIQHAVKNKIPYMIKALQDKTKRDIYGKEIATILNQKEITTVVLAGFMTVLPKSYFTLFKGITINIHPGVIPDEKDTPFLFPDGSIAPWNQGLVTEKAIANFLGKRYAGSTVHIVTEEADMGPVLERRIIKTIPKDTIETLYTRLKKEEHEALISSLNNL